MKWGWLGNSISNVITSHLAVLTDSRYVLVTCVDSNFKVGTLLISTQIVESEAECSILGDSLLIAGANIAAIAERHNLFNGFDEIWLYRECPQTEKPRGISIVSPIDLNVERPSQELLDWFDQTGCILGLGDGIGMNFIREN